MSSYPKVFGSFDVHYNTSEFEKLVTDSGYYSINLMPECRVFIFGTEVSADVLSVTTNNTINDIGTCSISLANPRNKYVLQKNDLCKNWREDKDILSAYNYDFFKKQVPSGFTDKLKNAAASLATSLVGTSINTLKGKHISTRKVFETKFYSGMTKQVGDFVFDYRDPVVVFFKGRFSPLWYFGFTGLISGFDENYQSEGDSVITINCESPLHMWKKQQVMQRTPLIAAGMFEYRHTAASAVDPKTGVAKAYDFLNIHGVQGLSFNRFVQYVAYGSDGYKTVKNTSLVINNIVSKSVDVYTELQESEGTKASSFNNVDDDNSIDYFLWNAASKDDSGSVQTKTLIKNIFKACKMYDINTDSSSIEDITKSVVLDYMCSNKLINIKKEGLPHPLGQGKTTTSGCNESSDSDKVEFSSWQGINLQYIKICPKVFTKENEINKYFESSLRMWDKNPIIPTNTDGSCNTVTGWEDNQCFAIAGSNPALKYSHIDYFEMLSDMWSQIYNIKQKSSGSSDTIDKLIISPADKIREIVVGSSTAYHCDTAGTQNSTPVDINGIDNSIAVDINHASFFRPRLFLLAPRRYNSTKSSDISPFLDMSLTKMQSVSCFDALRDLCIKLDYCMYSTAAGDIVIEPYMYDMQPTLFMENTQYRNYYTDPISSNDYKVTVAAPSLSNYDNTAMIPTINFGERSVHPLTIMNKDVVRCTNTFDSNQIATSAKVITSMQEGAENGTAGAAVESAINQSELWTELCQISYDLGKSDATNPVAIYIADGIKPDLFMDTASKNVSNEYSLLDTLKQSVLNSIINNNPTITFRHLLISTAEEYFTPTSWLNNDANIQPIPDDILETFKNHNYLTDGYLSKLNIGDTTQVDSADTINFSMLERVQRISKSIYDYKISLIKDYFKDSTSVAVTLSIPEDTTDAFTDFNETTKSFPIYPAFASTGIEEDSLCSVYKSCQASYNLAASALADATAAISIAAAKTQLAIAKMSLERSKTAYVSAVKSVWNSIDSLISSDSTAKEDYEDFVVTTMINVLCPSLYQYTTLNTAFTTTKRSIDVSNTETLSTLYYILSSGKTHTVIDLLMPGSKVKDKKTGLSWTDIILDNFLYIFRDYVLLDADTAQDSTKVVAARKADTEYSSTLVANVKSSGREVKTKIRSLKDLKELAQRGLYRPKRDLFRLYGYQPAPPKTFLYVSKKDKDAYAMMYLNQFIGQMYRLHIDVLGRPEVALNRPHYVSNKDCIGLSTNYSVMFSYGSDFSTSINLNYIRKNSFSYLYTLDSMDAVGAVDTKDSINNTPISGNEQAYLCLKNYFSMIAYVNKASKALKSTEDALLGGSIITSSTPTESITSLISKLYPSRGIHGVYDTIGHIDFDKRIDEVESKNSINSLYNVNSINPYDDENVRKISNKIDTLIDNRSSAIAMIALYDLKIESDSDSYDIANNIKESISSMNLHSNSGMYDQLIANSSTDSVKLIKSDTEHGLSINNYCATVTIKLNDGSGVKLSDAVTAYSKKQVKFSFKINSSSASTISTSPIDISSGSITWSDIINSFNSISGTTSIVNYIDTNNTLVSSITLNFTDVTEPNSYISLPANALSDAESAWSIYKKGGNAGGYLSFEGSKASSSKYDFILSSYYYMNNMKVANSSNIRKLSVDISGKKTWGELCNSIQSVVSAYSVTVAIANDGYITIKGTKDSDTKLFAVIESVPDSYGKYVNDLLKGIKNNSYSIGIDENDGFSKLQKKLNNSAVSSLTSISKRLDAHTDGKNKAISNAKKYSKELYGFLDVSDDPEISENSEITRLTYDIDDDDLNTILATWTVKYLQTPNSYLAQSASESAFGELLMATYKATNDPNYQIVFISSEDRAQRKVNGNYVKTEVTSYLNKIEEGAQTYTANTNVLKKYVWDSKTDSVMFNVNRPTPEELSQYKSMTYDSYLNKYLTDVNYGKSGTDIITTLTQAEELEVMSNWINDSRSFLVTEREQNGVKASILKNPLSALQQIDSFLSEWGSNYVNQSNSVVNILGFASKEAPGVTEDQKEEYNLDLAARRANLIAQAFMVGKSITGLSREYGSYVDSSRIGNVKSFGSVSNYEKIKDTSSNPNALNRRIEIEIIKNTNIATDYTVWEDWNSK